MEKMFGVRCWSPYLERCWSDCLEPDFRKEIAGCPFTTKKAMDLVNEMRKGNKSFTVVKSSQLVRYVNASGDALRPRSMYAVTAALSRHLCDDQVRRQQTREPMTNQSITCATKRSTDSG